MTVLISITGLLLSAGAFGRCATTIRLFVAATNVVEEALQPGSFSLFFVFSVQLVVARRLENRMGWLYMGASTLGCNAAY